MVIVVSVVLVGSRIPARFVAVGTLSGISLGTVADMLRAAAAAAVAGSSRVRGEGVGAGTDVVEE